MLIGLGRPCLLWSGQTTVGMCSLQVNAVSLTLARTRTVTGLPTILKLVETELRGRFQSGMRVDSAHGHEGLCSLMAEVDDLRGETLAAEDQASARLREAAIFLQYLRPVVEGDSPPALLPLSIHTLCQVQDLDEPMLAQRAQHWPLKVKFAEQPTPSSVSKLGGPSRESLSLAHRVGSLLEKCLALALDMAASIIYSAVCSGSRKHCVAFDFGEVYV